MKLYRLPTTKHILIPGSEVNGADPPRTFEADQPGTTELER